MKNLKLTIGIYIIASALIWGAAMIACSLKFKGTGCYDEISSILGGAAGFHLIAIWGPLAASQLKRLTKELKSEDQS
ncbi:MAG: hypothetical protein ISR95_04820 [Candidatus Marinimicrobia bacterium]|nr:hypothetical protein [Candidatus Brocadiales bacterium]MBL7046935.1 hypothetical protein [Candidatus Neomarinimicrobiota bacterium]